MPRAPAAIAFCTKRLPSVTPPFMATKTAPGRMRRESYSIPAICACDAPAAPTCATSAMSSFQFIPWLIVVREREVLACAMDDDFCSRGNHCAGGGKLLARNPVAADLHVEAGERGLLDDLAHG